MSPHEGSLFTDSVWNVDSEAGLEDERFSGFCLENFCGSSRHSVTSQHHDIQLASVQVFSPSFIILIDLNHDVIVTNFRTLDYKKISLCFSFIQLKEDRVKPLRNWLFTQTHHKHMNRCSSGMQWPQNYSWCIWRVNFTSLLFQKQKQWSSRSRSMPVSLSDDEVLKHQQVPVRHDRQVHPGFRGIFR